MKPSLLVAAFLIGMTGGCQKAPETPAESGGLPQRSGGNPITAPVDYLGAVANARKASEKVVSLTSLNQAIQLFNAQEDRLPANLDELVAQRYLPGLPPAPTGMKLAYNPKTGEVKLVQQ